MYAVAALIALMVACVSAQVESDADFFGSPQTRVASRARPPRPPGPDQKFPPQPYKFQYNSDDKEGTQQYREETGDENGVVRGKYGYRDLNGVYRDVEYIADKTGFRATVRTNEPGVGGSNPADVVMEVERPPPGLQERYTG